MTSFKTTVLKTAAIVLALATATAASAMAPIHHTKLHHTDIHSVAGKRTAEHIAIGRHHHAGEAHRVARHGTLAHRAPGTKVAATPSLRKVAENHRPSVNTSVAR